MKASELRAYSDECKGEILLADKKDADSLFAFLKSSITADPDIPYVVYYRSISTSLRKILERKENEGGYGYRIESFQSGYNETGYKIYF